MRIPARRPVQLGSRTLGGERSLICVPLVGRDREQLLDQAGRAVGAAPDAVEWRTDYLTGLTPEALPELLAELRLAVGCPIIVTCRVANEGGVGEWSDAERIAILESALEAGADAIDIEQATEGAGDLALRGRELGRPVILSSHNFASTPPTPRLLEILERQQAMGAAVVKLAVMPNDPRDVARTLNACYEARTTFLQTPLIAMSLGPLGAYSRVVGSLYGIDLTFAVVAEASAPGQLAIGDLRAMRKALGVS